MSENVYGHVPAVGNPLKTQDRADAALVRGGYTALHGEPAVDWSGIDTPKPRKRRGRPPKKSD